MEWLLKIVEGPMKGAEIALVEGATVSFGSDIACDIVVQDATVPAKAFELEVDDAGVRMAVGGGSAEPLPAFETRAFGTTTIAVGPVDGEWQELIKPARPQLERGDAEAAPGTSREADSDGGRARTPAAPPGAAAPSDPSDAAPTARRASAPYRLLACCCTFAVLAVIVFLAWYFWPQIIERYPKAEEIRISCVDYFRSARDSRAPASVSAAVPSMSLADIASAHHLKLTTSDGAEGLRALPKLEGNLRRRTERLAIRALALAADPKVKLDLTDDETLLAAASELAFACSDGALKVLAASNRVVTLGGYAPSAAALEKALRALNTDVKGIERVETGKVAVGGPAPKSVANTPYVEERLPGEHPVVAIPAHTPEPPTSKATRDFPIAGILTVPYPCVVMRNGLRLFEGAAVGTAVLVKIAADELTFRDGDAEFKWRP